MNDLQDDEVIYQDAPLIEPLRAEQPERLSVWKQVGIYLGLVEEEWGPEVVVIPRDRRGVLPAYVNGVPDLRMSGDGTYVNPRVRDADTLREQTEVPLPERNALHWAAEEARLKQQREQAEPMPDTLMDFLDAVEHNPGEQA